MYLGRVFAAALLIAFAGGAQASVTYTEVGVFEGNGCGGNKQPPGITKGGVGDGSCSYNGSAAILKYDSWGNGSAGNIVKNTVDYAFFNPDWITFEFIDAPDNNAYSYGEWKYDPMGAANAPGITGAYFKGGPDGLTLYKFDAPYYGGSQTFVFDVPGKQDISNAVFFNTDASVIPVPAALPLLALGLAGFGAYRHRQRKTRAA